LREGTNRALSKLQGAVVMLNTRESSVAILGVAIDNFTMAEVLSIVEEEIAEGGFHQIATANADFLVNSVRDEELRETLNRCDVVLADGMPLVWASRFLGTKLKERVAGADLVPKLAMLSAQRGYRIFMLGADEESSAGAARWMQKNCPGVCISGRFSPAFRPLEEMDHEDILSRIEAAKPDILLVAFGNPKQEKWIAMHRNRLRVPVCIGVGGSFEFLSGRVRRAPVWMQCSGLEWIFRTLQEPSRLAKRYFNNGVGLLRYLPAQMVWTAAQSKQRKNGQITAETAGTVKIVRIYGNLTESILPQFESNVRSALVSGLHVVLDMSHTTYIGADALGSLIHVLNLACRWRRDIWLAGLHANLIRVIQAAQLRPSFRIASRVAEALRRIEPDLVAVPHFDGESTFFRIRGQLVPVYRHELPELCRQVGMVMQQRLTIDSLAIPPADVQERASFAGELLTG
jgi:N-acetylglucosaminyldiphosphoundecaprenol N-acetyl-beta-D-mannosaminyltransferase